MEALERENEERRRRGVRERVLSKAWTHRPRLAVHEQALWHEFLRFAQFCSGDPRPTDAVAWFDMREVAHAERPWLAELFATLSSVLREPKEKTNG